MRWLKAASLKSFVVRNVDEILSFVLWLWIMLILSLILYRVFVVGMNTIGGCFAR